jgi:subtilase family serine protease
MVSVTNNGTAAAGRFKVAWLSNQTTPRCDWTVNSLAVGERQDLECTFVYSSQTYPANSNTFWIAFVVDPGSHIPELDEGNNKKEAQWTVNK